MAKQGESPPDTFPARVLGEDGKIVGASIEVTQKPGVTQGKLLVGVRVKVPGFHVGEMLKWTWLAPMGELVDPSLLLSAGKGEMLVLDLPAGWSELPFRFILCQRSSEELMLQVRDFDDEVAYDGLDRRHRKKIWNFFKWKTGNDADDLTQDVWVKVWAGRCGFMEGNKFISWLWKITRNTWIDWLRNQRRNVQTVSLDDFLEVLSEQTGRFAMEFYTQFSRAWERLNPKEQYILFEIYRPDGKKRTRKKLAEELEDSRPTLRDRERKAVWELAWYLAMEGIPGELPVSSWFKTSHAIGSPEGTLPPRAQAVSPNRKFLARLDESGKKVELLQAGTKESLGIVSDGGTNDPKAFVFSPDSLQMAVLYHFPNKVNVVELLSVVSKRQLRRFSFSGQDYYQEMAFSPYGRHIALRLLRKGICAVIDLTTEQQAEGPMSQSKSEEEEEDDEE